MASNEEVSTKNEFTEEYITKRRNELLDELQTQIDLVDINITSLAESFDVLYNKLKETTKDIDNDEQKREQDHGSRTESPQQGHGNVSHLMSAADTVKSRQTKAIKSLSKLIHFIHADREDICTNKSLTTCGPLHIDDYCQRTKDANNDTDSFIDMLLEQNKRLQERYKLMSEHSRLVSKRETLVSDERFRLRKQLDEIYANMDSSKSSGYCMVYNNDLSAKDENDTQSHDMMSDSDDTKQAQQNDLKKAEERISDLESQLAEIQKSVVTGEVYEVCSVYTRPILSHYPEKDLEAKIQDSMSDLGFVCDIGKDVGTDKSVTIIFMYASSLWEWDEMIKRAPLKNKDNSPTAVVMLYGIGKDGLCQNVMERHSHVLDKFSVFSFAFTSYGTIRARKLDVTKLVQFIIDASQPQSMVIGCQKCKKSLCKGNTKISAY